MAEEDQVTSGMRALYKFEGNGNNSVSGTGLPGTATKVGDTLTSIVSWVDTDFRDHPGFGKALGPASSRTKIPNLGIDPYRDDYTICMWGKTPLPPDMGNVGGFAMYSDNTQFSDILIFPFHVNLFGNTRDINMINLNFAVAGNSYATSHTLNRNEWVFIAIRKSGNSVSYAIDSNTFVNAPSVLISENGDTSNITNFMLQIGWVLHPNGRIISSGQTNIDSLRIYNRAITDTELTKLRAYRPPQPPVLAPIGNRAIVSGNQVRIVLSATDPNGDTITYSKSGVGSLTGNVFTWTPSTSNVGNHDVTFTATAGGDTDSETIRITVSNPVVAAKPPTARGILTSHSVEVGTAISDGFSVHGGSGNSGTITTTTDLGTVSNNNWSWTPTIIGNYTATITVTQGNKSSTYVKSIEVTGVPLAPTITSLELSHSLSTSQSITDVFQVVAGTHNNGEITVTHTGSGSLSANKRAFIFPVSTAASYTASIEVEQGGLSNTYTITIVVTAPPPPPITPPITPPPPPAQAPTITGLEGSHVVEEGTAISDGFTVVSGTDNSGSITVAEDGPGTISRSGSTNNYTYSWTPTTDGDYTNTITVTQGGESRSYVKNIEVTDPMLIVGAPSISGLVLSHNLTVSNTEITDGMTAVSGTNNTATKTITHSGDGRLVRTSATSDSYTFAFRPSTIGSYSATLRVTQGDLRRIYNITITVSAARQTSPPVITPISNISARVGDTVTFNVRASDPDGNVIAFTTNNNNVTVGAITTSTISGTTYRTATVSWSNIRSTATLVITATAGGESSSISVKITVGANRNPVLTAIGNQSFYADEENTIELSATDADGHDVTFLRSGSNGSITGTVFSWTPTSTGRWTIIFTARDTAGGTDTESVVIDVVERPSSRPTLFTITDKAVRTGSDLEFIVRSTDEANQEVVFQVNLTNASITFEGYRTYTILGRLYTEATFTWREVPEGTHYLYINAVNPSGGFDSEPFTVTATDNRPPIMDAIGDQVVLSGQTIRLILNAVDPEGGDVIYRIENGYNIGMDLDAETGEFVWTPPPITPGAPDDIYTIGFLSSDNVGNESPVTVVDVRVIAPSSVSDSGTGSIHDIVTGQVLIYDDEGSDNQAEWVKVFSRDYRITRNVVLDNGLIRVFIGRTVESNQLISVYEINRGDDSTGEELYTVMVLDDNKLRVTTINDISFRNISFNQVSLTVQYERGVKYDISLGRGMPYVNIVGNVKSIAVHRSVYAHVGDDDYVESMWVPAFKGEYGVTKAVAGSHTHDFNELVTYTDLNSNAKKSYVKSNLTAIGKMYSNYIAWCTTTPSEDRNKYADVMCFVRHPVSIVRSDSELAGHGDYPSANFIKTIVTFNEPFRIALGHLDNFLIDTANVIKFIKLTDEACQRVFERNYIRRRD